jgi:hypothetical protein
VREAMPRKPTNPFGTMDFSKDGHVRPNIRKLSDEKSIQETEAISIFIGQLRWLGVHLPEPRGLPEADHDFLIANGRDWLHIQLTELVDRTFATELEGGAKIIDTTAQIAALSNLIETKLRKRYAKPSNGQLWLVIFTTAHYPTEYVEGHVLKCSAGLLAARRLLGSCPSCPFDAIWFTNLITRPVQVWPARP